MKTVLLMISGKVQGVFFRKSTQENAFALGLSGYAKNLPSGEVEVVIQGLENSVEKLAEWCHRGPDSGRVDQVIKKDVENPEKYVGFKVL